VVGGLLMIVTFFFRLQQNHENQGCDRWIHCVLYAREVMFPTLHVLR
jgi:hypothetical protein